MWLYVPVRITARLGAQIELVQKQLSKRMPSFAMRSRFGGLVDAAVVATHSMRCVIVGHDKEDVGTVCRQERLLLKLEV